MIAGITFKICGLTRPADAKLAAEIGADYLGVIHYPKSPRYVDWESTRELLNQMPAGPQRVSVMVEPGMADLSTAMDLGFDRFQIHFKHTTQLSLIREWSELVGRERLWLAPKLPPELPVAEPWLACAKTLLLDTFHETGFGGSGKTGDWSKFGWHLDHYPETQWVLAGGLTPDNIKAALTQSGASFVDINSGVESAPGEKDHHLLRNLASALSQFGEITS